MNRAAGMIATSVLADSAIEHYRGSFHNKAMCTPLVAAALSLGCSAHGSATGAQRPTRARRRLCRSGADRVGRHGLHILQHQQEAGRVLAGRICSTRRPSGRPRHWRCPALLGFLVGASAGQPGPGAPHLRLSRPVARSPPRPAVGLLGTVAEAGLLHFRGAYHDPFMYLPVTVPPVAAVLLGDAALGRRRERRPLTRFWLRFTALLGLLVPVSTSSASRAAWAAGGTGARTSSTVLLFRAALASPAWRWRGCRAWPDGGSRPMTDRYPGYDVLTKRYTPPGMR